MMFKVNLRFLEKKKTVLEQDIIEPNFEIEFDSLLKCTKMHLKISIEKISEGFLVDGELLFDLLMLCDRCGDEYNMQTQESFSLFFTFDSDLIKEDSEDIFLLEEDEVEFYDIFHEKLILSLPMKSLCNSDCKGLCLSCGANLNYEKCNCGNEEKQDDSFAEEVATEENIKWKEQLLKAKTIIEKKN